MDNKFLHRVLDQLVYETRIDHDEKKIFFSFFSFSFFLISLSSLFASFFPFFSHHCRDIYGLNEQEIDYVWEEYRNIIIYKIENG
jgi:hypothetical protein